jgi:hypothetical protein
MTRLIRLAEIWTFAAFIGFAFGLLAIDVVMK